MAENAQPTPKRLKDYQPPAYLVDFVSLDFQLDEANTEVEAELTIRRNPALQASERPPLVLNGEGLTLLAICLDGQRLPEPRYTINDETLTIHEVPDRFTLSITNRIQPDKNTALEGLYVSNHIFCTQCEAEGFRKITYFLDRPDVMARYRTRIEADKAQYPVLLSNGNRIDGGDLPRGRHFVAWQDPFPKPSYLFALVGGRLAMIEDRFFTRSGREVALQIYTEPAQIDKCGHAMASLKRAMCWDEERFGLEYDLDQFMIVAISDFNMGAMENKGLNLFNTKFVLAKPETATDADFLGIERVIAHEYFHNWTGNRVTCRDWFQLSLKEGLTVFRDQEFTSDLHSRAVKRIDDVKHLRAVQFPEDAGPLAHPVRPESYVEINNFYTTTVYEKGAEIVRMLHTLLGETAFQRGMRIYFERHDGQAVTCDDFIAAMEAASAKDLTQFRRWYSQAGTPRLQVKEHYDDDSQTFCLTLSQSTPPTPGQPEKLPFHIPIEISLLYQGGAALPLQLDGEEASTGNSRIFELKDETLDLRFAEVQKKPVSSVLRGFSAPVVVERETFPEDLLFQFCHDDDPFNRWEAGQSYSVKLILDLIHRRNLGEELTVDSRLVETFDRILADRALDQAFVAQLLDLPAESYIGQQMSVIDVDRVHEVRSFLRQAIGRVLFERWEFIYLASQTNEPYAFTAGAVGRRSLKNLALAYLFASQEKAGRAFCYRQFGASDNMTDSITALSLIARDEDVAARAGALGSFYDRWQDDALVIDKWFAIQAVAQMPESVATVQRLLDHSAFKLTNPNRVRSLIGSFAMGNLTGFHRDDGSGYRLVASTIVELDRLNPQIAARLLGAFGRWRRFDDDRQEKMRTELERILQTPSLSRDAFEIASKTLA